MEQKAIFLDRDGVINFDPGDYTKNLAEFQVLPTVINRLEEWSNQGYWLFVITNQAGIDKQLYTHTDVQAMHQYFQGLCVAAGFNIAEFFYCPHHPNFSGKCLCRKPGYLMVQKALHKYNLSPENCVFIGDKARDIDCASALGVKGILIETNSDLARVNIQN